MFKPSDIAVYVEVYIDGQASVFFPDFPSSPTLRERVTRAKYENAFERMENAPSVEERKPGRYRMTRTKIDRRTVQYDLIPV